MAQCFARLHLDFWPGLAAWYSAGVTSQHLAFGASRPRHLVNGALFWVCSCADGPGAPGAHLLVLERMVAKKPAPQHSILVCARSSTPGQATSRGARGPGGGDPAAGHGWGTVRRLQSRWGPRAVTSAEGRVGMFPRAAGEAARDGNFPGRGENSQQIGDRPGRDRAVRRAKQPQQNVSRAARPFLACRRLALRDGRAGCKAPLALHFTPPTC